MAVVQAGMTFGRVVLCVGAGLVASRIPQVADFLAELKDTARERGGVDAADSSSNAADATNVLIKTEFDSLLREVRKIVLNNSVVYVDTSKGGAGAALIVPVAAVGAVGYCYMWWKGITFSSLMYVTKRNMANAVASMTKHLEQVQSSIAAAKKHLAQRIQHVDDRLEQQKEISVQIRDQVTGAKLKIKNIGSDMDKIKFMVMGLDEKMDSIEAKQNYSCAAVSYLCQFIEEKGERLPERVEALQQTVKRIGYSHTSQGLGFGQLLTIDSASTSVGRMLRSTAISSTRLILP